MEPASELSADPFRAIIEQSLAGIYVMQDERFVYSNATWAGMTGRTPEEVAGMHLRDLVSPDLYDFVLDRYYQRLRGEVMSLRFLTKGIHKDGHIVHIEIHGSRMIYGGRPAVGGVGIDVSERVAQEEQLRQSREQLQALAAYTNRKLEDQRLAFARDVHDELGGMLTALKMQTSRLLRRAQSDELRELTHGVLDLTQQTIEAVKAISEAARPSALDHIGLRAAMLRDLEDFSTRSGATHVLRGADVSRLLSPKRTNAIYRIFQEGLTNVARHAEAAHVEVDLAHADGWCVMELRDDGRGFVPSILDRGSLGLLSMTERARDVGGQLQIQSAPGRGTGLVLRVPLL